jgi:hypothetical protein
MAKPRQDVQSLVAKQGEKMIEIRLRLWTNNIAPESGQIVPKHAWASGVVMIESNSSHGIKPKKARPFHTLLDVGGVIEKVLVEHEIVLHPSKKMQKYLGD